MIFTKDLRFQFFKKKKLRMVLVSVSVSGSQQKNKIVNLKSGFGSGSWKNILKFQF